MTDDRQRQRRQRETETDIPTERVCLDWHDQETLTCQHNPQVGQSDDALSWPFFLAFTLNRLHLQRVSDDHTNEDNQFCRTLFNVKPH